MRILYRLVWIVSLLAILGMSVWFLTLPPTLPVIAPLVPYTSEDKSLSVQYPGNWKPRASSSQTVAEQIAFDPSAGTHFAISSSLAGSLMGDIAKSNSDSLSQLQGMAGMAGLPAPGSADKQKSPLETMHAANLKALAKNKTHYPDFVPAETHPTQIDGVESLRTDFTFTQGGVWGKRDMIGTCVTTLTKEREVTVTATAPKALQKTLTPLFDKMIASIRFGQTGG